MIMSYKGKNVLVTGGAGVIGMELVAILKRKGATVRCIDMVEKPRQFPDVEYFQMDLSRFENQILFRFEPEIVFHLAADFERSEESEDFWESNFSNNVMASHYLLRHVLSCPTLKRIIFASSYLIYNKHLYSDIGKVSILDENSTIDPRNLCGVAKLQTERDIEFFASIKNFSHVSARIFRVYGKGSRDVISRWVRSAISGEPITVFSEDNKFDYIYAGDVAEGLVKLEESGATGIFNLGTGTATAIKDVVKILERIHPSIEINRIDKTIWNESSCASMEKAKQALGWLPPTTVDEGILKLFAYERERMKDAASPANR